MMQAAIEIDAWLRWLGVVGYLASFTLAVMWAALCVLLIRQDARRRQLWSVALLALLCYAAIAANLVLIAMEPSWLNRVHITTVQRSLSVAASAAGWLFTGLYLRAEYKTTRSG